MKTLRKQQSRFGDTPFLDNRRNRIQEFYLLGGHAPQSNYLRCCAALAVCLWGAGAGWSLAGCEKIPEKFQCPSAVPVRRFGVGRGEDESVRCAHSATTFLHQVHTIGYSIGYSVISIRFLQYSIRYVRYSRLGVYSDQAL